MRYRTTFHAQRASTPSFKKKQQVIQEANIRGLLEIDKMALYFWMLLLQMVASSGMMLMTGVLYLRRPV